MKIHCSQCVIVLLQHIMESLLLYSIMPHSCRFRLINGIYFYEYEVTDFSEIVVQFLSFSTVVTSKSFLWTQFAMCWTASPQNSYVKALNPNTSKCDCIWHRAFEIVNNEAIRVGTNPIRLVFLSEEEIWSHKETLGMCAQRKYTWGHKEKAAIWKPKRETSRGTIPAHILILDFQPLKLWENKFMLFKLPSL